KSTPVDDPSTRPQNLNGTPVDQYSSSDISSDEARGKERTTAATTSYPPSSFSGHR
ncbi:hypothetical protein BGZ73_001471, partial [Actinomortierella ambigua]